MNVNSFAIDQEDFNAYLTSKSQSQSIAQNVNNHNAKSFNLPSSASNSFAFLSIAELEEDGFYFNPNFEYLEDDKLTELMHSEKEFTKKYCTKNEGRDLNENHLFVSTKTIIDSELIRLNNALRNKQLHQIKMDEFELLLGLIGFDKLRKILRIIDLKCIKLIKAKQSNRTFYSVLSQEAKKKKDANKWRQINKRRKNQRMHCEIGQNEENQSQRKRKWKYRVIGSCKQQRMKRNKMRMRRRQKNRIKALNGEHWPKYKMIASVQGSNAQRLSHNVFIQNTPFCSCDEFKSILRRFYSLKHLKAKDVAYKHKAFNLPFCSHIFAVKLALILNQIEIESVSEEEWAQRAIKHISHQMYK